MTVYCERCEGEANELCDSRGHLRELYEDYVSPEPATGWVYFDVPEDVQ